MPLFFASSSTHTLLFGTVFQTMNSVFSGLKGWPQALFGFLSSSCKLSLGSEQRHLWFTSLVLVCQNQFLELPVFQHFIYFVQFSRCLGRRTNTILVFQLWPETEFVITLDIDLFNPTGFSKIRRTGFDILAMFLSVLEY